MTISPKFWLIGYILIGFSYLKEKIATSGHLFHFYKSITTLCGQTWPKLLSVKSCFIHKFRIISQKVNIGSTFVRHLEDYRWEGKIGGEGHWCNWAIKTYLPQMGLHWFSWKCQQTKTFAISDGFASLNLNWFHQTSGMFSGVGFWLRCQVPAT